jgi:hypothetical protein
MIQQRAVTGRFESLLKIMVQITTIKMMMSMKHLCKRSKEIGNIDRESISIRRMVVWAKVGMMVRVLVEEVRVEIRKVIK